MLRVMLTFLVILAFSSVSGELASAAMRGELDLKYVDYTVRGDDRDTLDATSFSQRYAVSLFKDKRKESNRNRYLEYDYLLGYEWVAFDTKVSTPEQEEERKVRAGRLYYAGELLADPASVPVKMRLYARDTARPAIAERTIMSRTTSLLTTSMADDLYGTGTSIQLGANLLVGVKSTLSARQSDLFSHLPLFMLDFRHTTTKNDSPYSRIDNRLTELAFVSLNRRDNWFHYRYKTYEDRIAPLSDWKESQYQIGTVDVRRMRKWVDLTNWIRVSADAVVTNHEAANPNDSFQAYALNLFLRGNRRTWQFTSLNSLSRMVKPDSIETVRSIPVTISGSYGGGTTWSLSATARDRQYLDRMGGGETESLRSISGRVSLFNRGLVTLSPMISAQKKNATNGSLYTVTALAESSTTQRFSPTSRYQALYRFFLNAGEEAEKSQDEYLLHEVKLSGRWILGKGSLSFAQSLELSFPLNGGGNPKNDYQKSSTSLEGGWSPNNALSMSFAAGYMFTGYSAEPSSKRTNLGGRVHWGPTPHLRTEINTTVLFSQSSEGTSRSDKIFGTLEYEPEKTFFVRMFFADTSTRSLGVRTPSREFRQLLRYSWYPGFVLNRRFLEVEEEFVYLQRAYDVTTSHVRIGTRFFPTARLSLYGNISTYLTGYDQLIYSVGGNFDFRLLQASLDYSHGKRTGNDSRREDRWTASIRRTF